MAISPTQRPDDNTGTGSDVQSGTDAGRAWSGTSGHAGDPTSMKGQYPPGGWGSAIFGGQLPSGTGAPGTAGAHYSGDTDATNEPGQLNEGLSGLGPADTARTGAPGGATTPNTTGGGTAISYTNPGAYLAGSYQSEAVSDDLAGGRDSTQANDQGYASGGPKLPGMAEPAAGGGRAAFQPGDGHVMRGGRAINP